MEQYITRKQAIDIFRKAGLSESTFRRRVKQYPIPTIIPESRQRGALYEKAAVRGAAQVMRIETITFAKCLVATPGDMPEIASVIEELFGVYPDIARWQSWMLANPDVGLLLRTVEDQKVVGCAFLLPLPEEKILDILEWEVTPPTSGSDILAYSPDQSVCLYIRSVGVLQQVPVRDAKHWGQILLLEITKTIINLGVRGIIIEKIYGRSDSKQGEYAMRRMGMTQIRTKTSHHNFMIDVKRSGLPMVMKYWRELEKWQSQHAGE